MQKEQDNRSEVLVDVQNVSKKFCKNLKKSMIYGFTDLFRIKKTNKIRLRKDEFWALQDVSLSLKRGEMLAILGLNGAGKTTLIRLITKTFPVSSGRINLFGRIVTIYEKNRALNKFYSGRENIKVKCALFQMSRKETMEKIDTILNFAEIKEFADAPFGTYSTGMKARINFAIAFYSNPDIIIIDEGFATSDRKILEKYIAIIRENSHKFGVIIISHNQVIIKELANKIVILKKGKVFYNSYNVSKGLQIYNSYKNNTKTS